MPRAPQLCKSAPAQAHELNTIYGGHSEPEFYQALITCECVNFFLFFSTLFDEREWYQSILRDVFDQKIVSIDIESQKLFKSKPKLAPPHSMAVCRKKKESRDFHKTTPKILFFVLFSFHLFFICSVCAAICLLNLDQPKMLLHFELVYQQISCIVKTWHEIYNFFKIISKLSEKFCVVFCQILLVCHLAL